MSSVGQLCSGYLRGSGCCLVLNSSGRVNFFVGGGGDRWSQVVHFEFQSVELRLFDSTIRSTVVIQKVMVVHDIIQFLDRRVSMWRAWCALA